MKIADILKSIIAGLYASLKRFPVAIGLSTAATILLIVITNNDNSFSRDTLEIIGRIVMVLALGIPVSLCTKLLFERKENAGLNMAVKAGIYLLEAIGLVLYYFLLLKDFSMVTVTRYIAFTLSFYMAFIFIPYFYKRDGFELYVIKLLTRFFTTVIYSIVLFLGIVAIIFTIDKLLEIRMGDNIYFDVWLSVVGVFAVSFFLAGVPAYMDQFETDSYPKLLNVLLLYIVMPILSVYTAILYIYFAKILVTLQWPVGLVAHLVLWYSVICAAVVFLISPLHKVNRWSHTFMFLLPKLIIPLLIMMFVSVGIRVRAYGITENRYFVIILGLWVLGIMLYYNFTKTRRNIILPISLAIIAVLSVVGPWSSYSVSRFSQNQRLEGILQSYDMISDNAIVKAGRELSDKDKKEISEILTYFSRSHSLNDVRYLPKDFKLSQMKDVFGFSNTVDRYYDGNEGHFSYNSNLLSAPIDVGGYDYMFPADTFNPEVSGSANGIEVIYDNSTHEAVIKSGGREIYRKSLAEYGKQLHNKYGTEYKYNIAPEEMSLTDENEHIRVKFIFTFIDGYEDEDGNEIDLNTMNFYVLVDMR